LAIALALAVSAVACESDQPGEPSDIRPVFTATLTTAAEVPAVVNGETGGGTVRITLNLTQPAGGPITAATADFEVTLSGFAQTSAITLAHIHDGAVGVQGPISVNTGLGAGQVALTNGGATFNRNGINVDPATAQRILDNPQGFYFNVHSQANQAGIVRGQLTRIE
jgi:hypothetical protein